jgi:protein AbiQ
MNNFSINFLSQHYYNLYANCKQILKKQERPYLVTLIELDGKIFAVPLRTNDDVPEYKIKRKEKDGLIFLTKNIENKNKCLDFSKSIIVKDPLYLGSQVKINDTIQKLAIINFEKNIIEKLKRYIHQYKRKFMLLEAGKYHKDAYYFCAQSSFLYFHQEFGLSDPHSVIENAKNHLILTEQILPQHAIEI